MAAGRLQPRPSKFSNAWAALREDWPLYCFEASELATFMISACLFTAWLFASSRSAAYSPWLLRAGMGIAMGLTAMLIIWSPWGRRSGAHFNPAITLTFYRLGKIGPYDACFYIAAHFIGAIGGVGVAAWLLGAKIADPRVNYAVTVPGIGGAGAAFAAETFMAALMMAVVLYTSNRPRLTPYTTWCMGFLIANYILFFAPVSGFSVNPARTFGSAFWAHLWTAIWVYFTAPLVGMLGAAEVYVRIGERPVRVTGRAYFSHRHLVQRNQV